MRYRLGVMLLRSNQAASWSGSSRSGTDTIFVQFVTSVALIQLRAWHLASYAAAVFLKYRVARASVMRCMACGGEMLLAAVVSDEVTMPAGFRYETLQCAVCGDIERRFVFGRDAPTTSAVVPSPPFPSQPAPSSPRHEVAAPLQSPSPLKSASPVSASRDSASRNSASTQSVPREAVSPERAASSSTPAAALAPKWQRAVEKLRSRQAEIRVREGAGESDWKARLDGALERLAPAPRHPPISSNATAHRKSPRSLLADLGASSARDCAAPRTREPLGEAALRFNQLWDNLLPARHGSERDPNARPAAAHVLPPSVSLVCVEDLTGASLASRAVLLLRGSAMPG